MSKFIEDLGEVAQILPVRTGTTADGRTWSRQTIVVKFDRGDNITDTIAFEGGSRYIDDFAQLKAGDKVDIAYYVNSREWNGKWFTSANVYSISIHKELVSEKKEAAKAQAPACPPPAFQPSEAEGPDLPF